MTPAERARQIDRDEFAAECAAIRQRAYSRFEIEPQREVGVENWVKREEPKVTYRPFKVKRGAWTGQRGPQLHTVHGVTLTSRQWAERLGINTNAMAQRIHRHGSVIATVLKHIENNGPNCLKENTNGTA